MNFTSKLKIVAALTTVSGITLGFFERMFAPQALVIESSPQYPEWLAWLGFGMASIAALAYIAIDVFGKNSN